MSPDISNRPISDAEREKLKEFLKRIPTSSKRFGMAVANALVMWAVSILIFVMSWKLLAWLIRALLHRDFGWNSPVAFWLLCLALPVCLLLAIVSTVRWIKRWRDTRPLLLADLEGGRVLEELYQFTEAKRFQEQEHGGLMYFLRTVDDSILVLYDHESQDLGVRDENPLASAFQPRAQLTVVRAPHSAYVIEKNFSGDVIDAGEPFDLLAPPKHWPQQDSLLDLRWDELETKFSSSWKPSRRMG
jgi:hypothetical protein